MGKNNMELLLSVRLDETFERLDERLLMLMCLCQSCYFLLNILVYSATTMCR